MSRDPDIRACWPVVSTACQSNEDRTEQ